MSTSSSALQFKQGVSQVKHANAGTDTVADWTSLVGRVGIAALFLWSGYGKLAYMSANVAYMKAFGLPAAELLIWAALFVEAVGGAMLLVGWRTRWAAIALALFTIPATFLFHAYWNAPADQVLNQHIHFMKNVAILGGLLIVFAHGPGRLAVDRR